MIGTGLVGLAGSVMGLFGSASARAAAHDGGLGHGAGPLSSATVSFGAWMTEPPLDRFPNESPRTANHHGLCPGRVTVKSGACVNFVISGIHQVLIYDDGTLPGDIDTSLLVSSVNPPPPQLIDDPDRRIYRGLDPGLVPQDRIEVVHLDRPGTYLVVCGVLRHFQEGMYGFVTVLP